MLWLLGIGLFTLLLYIYMVIPFQYWKRLKVAQYSVIEIYRELLLGFLPYRSLVDTVQRPYNKFSDKRYVGIYHFGKPILFLRDPELVKQLTIKDFKYFTNHFSIFTQCRNKILHENMLSLKGDKWRNMRNILSPSFTSSKLKTVFSQVSDCSKQLVNHFDTMEDNIITVEMKEVFSKYANDVIATSAYGIRCNSFEDSNNDFLVIGNEMANFNSILGNLQIIILMALPKAAEILGLELFKLDSVNLFDNIITQNIQVREKHGIVAQDMIKFLLEAKRKINKYEEIVEEENKIYSAIKDNKNNAKGIQLTDEDIISQAFLFFFAGFEVVSITMSFMAHELAVNPDIQERLYAEILENTRHFGQDPSYESLMKMKYLDMVISESLRIYPPAPIGDRVCAEPYTLQATTKDETPIHLEVGDLIWFPIYSLHRDPKYFPNPDRFDPERFSDENKHNIIPGTYLPFGIGPRHCIGNRFALMEMKLAVYYILSKFKIVVVDKTQIPLKLARSQVSMNAENGFWVGLEKRVTD